MKSATQILPLLAVSAFFFYLGSARLKEQQNRSEWPRFDARIVKSHVKEARHTQGTPDASLILDLELEMDSKVKKYRRNRISGAPARLQKMSVTRFKKGATIGVYINPEDEEELLFEVSHSWGPYLLGFLPGSFFLLLGISLLQRSFRSSHIKQSGAT